MNSLERCRALLPEARRLMLPHPNVVGIGLGIRDSQLVWRVYVSRKFPAANLPPGAAVPPVVLDVPTDVICAQTGRPSAGPPKEYTAGIDIESNGPNSEASSGSLGCFATDSQNRPVLLTCSHVLFPGFAAVPSMAVYQPYYSSCCSGGDAIATPIFDATKVEKGKYTEGFNDIPCKINIMGSTVPGHASETDCAIALLNPGIMFKNVWRVKVGESTTDIPITGAVTEGLGVVKGPPLGTAPTAQQYVRIYTPRDDKLHYGTLLSTPPADIEHVDDPDHLVYRWGISDVSDDRAGAKAAVNQLLILPRPTPVAGDYKKAYGNGESLSFDHGDSGSVVINSDGKVVGLVCRVKDTSQLGAVIDRSKIELAEVGNLAVVNLIQNVLECLTITIPEVAAGFSGTVPGAGATTRVYFSGMSEDPEIAERRRAVEILRERLHTSARGRLILGKISEHRREVKLLFARVRAINAAWNEFAGPAFYQHALRSLRDPDHQIPASVNGITRAQLANVMLPLFVRYGSASLQRDIERYRHWAADVLLDIGSIQEAPDAVARKWSPA